MQYTPLFSLYGIHHRTSISSNFPTASTHPTLPVSHCILNNATELLPIPQQAILLPPSNYHTRNIHSSHRSTLHPATNISLAGIHLQILSSLKYRAEETTFLLISLDGVHLILCHSYNYVNSCFQ